MPAETRDWNRFLLLLGYVRRRTGWLGLSLLVMALSSLAGVFQPYLLKLGIDRDVASGDLAGLYRTAALLGAVLLGGLVCQFLFHVSVQVLGQKLLLDMRMDLFRKVLVLSNDYFDRTAAGKTMTHVTNDVEAIREFIADGIVSVIGDLLKVALIFAAMLILDLRLALLAFTTLPLFVLATALFRRSIRIGYEDVRKATAEINTALNETIAGIREIRLFGAEPKFTRQFEVHDRNFLDAYIRTIHAYALYFPMLEIISNTGMILILGYAHFRVGLQLQIGTIFAFFAYLNMFYRPLREMAEKFNTFQSALAATGRVQLLLDRPVTIREPARPASLPPRRGGEVEFADVSFAYDGGPPVLCNLSFRVSPGERVALVGYTGSGKTTVISLVNRLYDVSGGTVRLDGIDIRQLSLQELRRRIATIPQNVFLFTGTVAENISLHQSGVDRAQIETAAAQVFLDPFVRNFPRGYDENVLEEGRLLSAGQKQLLNFARALVRQPEIVILDEATSNIDSATEHLIENAIGRLLEGRTAIIIAHRLSTIRAVDRILVLHHGRLVEEGNHDALLAAGGLYSELYRRQAFLDN